VELLLSDLEIMNKCSLSSRLKPDFQLALKINQCNTRLSKSKQIQCYAMKLNTLAYEG